MLSSLPIATIKGYPWEVGNSNNQSIQSQHMQETEKPGSTSQEVM
jgi:hypothetical protein